jgi:protein gp37
VIKHPDGSITKEGGCYAEAGTPRQVAFGHEWYQGLLDENGLFNGVMHEAPAHIWIEPLERKKTTLWFVNSMSDAFHEHMLPAWHRRIFQIIAACPQHTFQILTKRPGNIRRHLERIGLQRLPDNVWIGVSVENADVIKRIDILRMVPAKIRFLSIEPLIGPLGKLNLEGIHWCITGGESGHHRRPCDPVWVRDIREQCLVARVAYFHKQWGGPENNPLAIECPPGKSLARFIQRVDPHEHGGALLDAKLWREFPE